MFLIVSLNDTHLLSRPLYSSDETRLLCGWTGS